MISLEEIKRIPKVELHQHLDGSLSPATVIDLAKKDNIFLPSNNLNELKNYLIPKKSSLVEYLKAFDITLTVLQTHENLEQSAWEVVQAWKNDGIIYGEIRFAPELHTQKTLTMEAAIEAVLNGLNRGKRDFDVHFGLILCAMRQTDTSAEVAALVKKYTSQGVVGFDIAGPEKGFPATNHFNAFSFIQNNALKATCHAGEAEGAFSIQQAVLTCRALRIGHGTRLYEDFINTEEPAPGSLSQYILDMQIPLEVCLTSNLQTQAVKTLKDHPLKKYFNLGYKVCLCTDNPLMSDTTLSKEILLAINTFDFTDKDIVKLQRNALEAAFCPFDQKQMLLRKL